MTNTAALTSRQIEALRAAYEAKLDGDGWLMRGFCRIWGIAPTAIMALERKGLLEMHRSRSQARLTDKGRELVEAEPDVFGLRQRIRAGGEPAWPRAPGAPHEAQLGAAGAHRIGGQPSPADAGRAPKEPT